MVWFVVEVAAAACHFWSGAAGLVEDLEGLLQLQRVVRDLLSRMYIVVLAFFA